MFFFKPCGFNICKIVTYQFATFHAEGDKPVAFPGHSVGDGEGEFVPIEVGNISTRLCDAIDLFLRDFHLLWLTAFFLTYQGVSVLENPMRTALPNLAGSAV